MSSESPTVSSAQRTGKTLTKGSALTSARASERGVAQQAFASDPKYKKFTQQVEKCLNSFDSVHEWADFIAFLKQLLKVVYIRYLKEHSIDWSAGSRSDVSVVHAI
ncbi:hypothetical protein C0989_001402 [Termitomyces sp. Mn162]|nr:hypothetical protein C0989_001402 [Termitomyces sp. Mn162]